MLLTLFSLGPLWRFLNNLFFFCILSSTSPALVVTFYKSYWRTIKHFFPSSTFLDNLLISRSKSWDPFFSYSFFTFLYYFSYLIFSCNSSTFSLCFCSFGFDFSLLGNSGIYVLKSILSSSKIYVDFLKTFSFSSNFGLNEVFF